MTKHLIALVVSAISVSTFGSPAATRQWVTNYVNNVVSNTVENQHNSSVINTEFEPDGTNGYMVVTFADGSVRKFHYYLSVENRDVKALMVHNSTINGLNNGTYFAYDYLNNEYRSSGVARPELATLKSSIYYSTNGVDSCEQLTATNVVSGSHFYTISTSNAFHLIGIEYEEVSNTYVRVGSRTADLIYTKISKTQAREIGVTNFQNTVSYNAPFNIPYQRSFADIIMSILTPSAFADNTTILQSPYSRDATITLNVNISADKNIKKYTQVPVDIHYSGPDSLWLDSYWGDDGYMYVRSPQVWPSEEDWYTYEYWFQFASRKFAISYRFYLSKEDQQQGILSPMLSFTINEKNFIKSFCTPYGLSSPAAYIPEWIEPGWEKYNWQCESRGHYWGRSGDGCVCRYCGSARPHQPEEVEGHKCMRCVNKYGSENDPDDKTCDLPYYMGGQKTPTPEVCHGGWHDADKIQYNMNLCVCECGVWKLVHLHKTEDSDYEPGLYDESTDEIITTIEAKNKWHVGLSECERGAGDDKCNAEFAFNEQHDWDYINATARPVYEDSLGKLYVAMNATEEANYDSRPSTYMFRHDVHATVPKCKDCGWLMIMTDEQINNSLEYHNSTKVGSTCKCSKCGHTDAHGENYIYQCGDFVYNYWATLDHGEYLYFIPYCTFCGWNKENSKADTNQHQYGHLNSKIQSKEEQDVYHICECELTKQPHKDDDHDKVCDVHCGYSFPYTIGRGGRADADDTESEIAFPDNEEDPDPQDDAPMPSAGERPDPEPGIETPEPPPDVPGPAYDESEIWSRWAPENTVFVAVMRGDWYVADPSRKEEVEALGTSTYPYVELVFQYVDESGNTLPGFVTLKYVFDYGIIGPLPSERVGGPEPEAWESEHIEGEFK